MAEGGEEVPTELNMEEVRRQLAELDVLQEANRGLRQQMDNMAATHAADMARLPQQPPTVNVQVTAPTPTPRLKVFTGLAPTGGNEVRFQDWEAQVEQLTNDPNVQDTVATVKTTLRGLALEQVRHCRTAGEILTRLRHTFGDVKAPDDLYLDFCETVVRRKELPSDFLLCLWNDLLQINKTTLYGEHKLSVKLYRAFVRAIGQSHPLLSLEIRNQFGYPGAAAPALADLLRAVRRLEESAAPARMATSHGHTVSNEDELVERIVAKVTESLRKASDQTVRPSRVLRGHCFNCGQEGNHYARDCPNPPNRMLVEQRDQQRRQQQQEPLNGSGHLGRSNQRRPQWRAPRTDGTRMMQPGFEGTR